ncbi:unnamed protein product [Symbiodinium natans]|uniref:Uncharacterized protein n=1 Tax=Symbiodinium natans TaxID=878477 RepID=A0A812ID70_9DINO|nr:unnamed protein product [Symbiodinium natans]
MAWILVFLFMSCVKAACAECRADECADHSGDATDLLQHVRHSKAKLSQTASELTTSTTTTTYHYDVCEELKAEYNISSLCIPKDEAVPRSSSSSTPRGKRGKSLPWVVEKAKAKAAWKVDVATAKAWWWCEKQWWCHNGPPTPPADCPISSSGSQLYSDRASFEAPLTVVLVDGYDNAAYFAGDNFDGANFDSFTDAAVSAIVGETQYETTGFDNNNLIPGQSSGDPLYCAGCNGSYRLSFQATSVGTGQGVWAAGFDIRGVQEGVFGTVAFVTYGDGSTGEFVLPERQDVFWGIIDCRRITSIHLGLSGGAPNTDNSVMRMAHDNLSIGA